MYDRVKLRIFFSEIRTNIISVRNNVMDGGSVLLMTIYFSFLVYHPVNFTV